MSRQSSHVGFRRRGSQIAQACMMALESRVYFGSGWDNGAYVPPPEEEEEDPIIDCGCEDDEDLIDDGVDWDIDGGGDGGPESGGSADGSGAGTGAAAGGAGSGNNAAKAGSGSAKTNSTDLSSNTFGADWGLTRSWLGYNTGVGGVGNGWMISQAPYLTIVRNQHDGEHGGIIQVVQSNGKTIQFEIGEDATTFTTRGRNLGNWLTYVPPTDDPVNEPGYFELRDSRGNITTFYDLPRHPTSLLTYNEGGNDYYYGRINGGEGAVQGVTEQWIDISDGSLSQTADFKYPFGALRSFNDASWRFTMQAEYDEDANLTGMVLTDGSGAFERYQYSYETISYTDAYVGTTNTTVVKNASLQKASSANGPWTTIRTAEYEYYDGTNAHGRLGDLKLVTISEPDPVTELSINTLVSTDTTATATISGHSFQAGDLITITGAEDTEYNGTFVVTDVDGNDVSFELGTNPADDSQSPAGSAFAHTTIDQKYYRYYKFHTFNYYPDNIVDIDGGVLIGGTTWYDNAGGTDATFPWQDTDTSPPVYDRQADNIVMSGLKAVVEGPALTRLIAAYGSYESLPDIDVDPATDTTGDGNYENDDIRSYANHFYKYQRYYSDTTEYTTKPMARYRVIEDIAAGEGCSTCSDGLGTTKRVYETNPSWKADPYDMTPHGVNGTAGVDPNKWVMKTTEYFPDTTNNSKTLGAGELTSTGTTATVAWTNHGFVEGDHIKISGANEAAYNGTFTIASASANGFTYTMGSDPADTATGTITVTNYDRIPISAWDDNDYQITYTNELGQVMLRVLVDRNGTVSTGDDKQYLTYYRYRDDTIPGSEGHVEYIAHPSAVASYDEGLLDLVDFGDNGESHILESGLIEHYTYATSTSGSISATVAGDVAGYLKGYSLKEGYSGSDVWIYTQDYYVHSFEGATVYPVANYIEHLEGDLGSSTDDFVTTYEYTWLEDGFSTETNRIESRTTMYQSVDTSHNGSGSSNEAVTVFDDVGRPVWTKDEAGFINYTEYDDNTGAVIKQIVDVDTSQVANEPAGWSTPGGGGLHLVTEMEVDGLGRTVKLTDPNGNITYTVYNDDAHEVRVYRGWNTTTHLPSSPTEITRQRIVASDGTVYSEYLTSTAIPSLNGSNDPTGQETINSWNIMSLSRSITNDAGQVIERDVYFSLAGITYNATSARLGSSSNDTSTGNYHKTLMDYDSRGRLKRTESATGTITRTLYDAHGLMTSTWVGTDDTPTSGFWSPTNTAGTNLVKLSENEYDHGGTGSGNLTESTSFSGGGADPRVTEMWYDWRNRLTATRQAADTAGTFPVVTFFTYDNLSRVLTTDVYGEDANFPDFGDREEYNWSFEAPDYLSGEHAYNPVPVVSPTWVFDEFSGLADDGYLGVSAADGDQMAFIHVDDLSDLGMFEQLLDLTDGHEYTISFKVQIASGSDDAYFGVDLDLIGNIYSDVVSSTSWQQVNIPDIYWFGDVAIQFFTTTESSDVHLFIDDVVIYDQTASQYVTTWGANASFETPDLTARSLDHEYRTREMEPVWTFNGNTGIAHNGSSLSNPSAPDGLQVAFLQTLSTVGGSIELEMDWDDGSYNITFVAAQRTGNSADQTILVYIDNELVGSYTPGGTSFTEYVTMPFEVEAGTHTLKLVTGNTTASDSVAFIDGVVVGIRTQISATEGVPERPHDVYLRSRTTTEYDELSRAFASHVFSVDPIDGAVSTDSLDTSYWYDSRGNVIKVTQPGGLVTKNSYDGAGRVTKMYQTDGGGDSVYGDADDVTGDIVLAQVEYEYDDNGNAILVTNRERFHDATDTGELGNPGSSGGTAKARVSYQRNYHDRLNRVIHSVNIGTYNGSAYTSSTDVTVPARSDTKLVASYEYASDEIQVIQLTGSPTTGSFKLRIDGTDTLSTIAYDASAGTIEAALEYLLDTQLGHDGADVAVTSFSGGWVVKFMGSLTMHNLSQMSMTNNSMDGGGSLEIYTYIDGNSGRLSRITDPRTTDGSELVPVTLFNYDMLGRKTQTIEGYDHTAPLQSTGNNRITQQTYNGNGSVLTLKAMLPDGTFQETAYIYGVSQGSGSEIDSNDILASVQYPDKSSGGADSGEQEDFTVNALGERLTYTDRNGNVHSYTYDVLGRMTSDAITTLGSGVDDAILRIEYAYDDAGRLYQVTSYDDDAGGSIVNQIQRQYNGLGQLAAEFQSHSGAVNTSTTPKVQYTFSEMDGGANHSRLTGIIYPDGRIVRHEYGTSSNVVSDGVNDSISRLTYLADDASGSIGTHLEEYEYLGLETVVKRVHPEPGVDLTYLDDDTIYGDGGDQYAGLDRFGRIADQRWTTSGWTDKDRFQYGYDRNGNVLYKDNLLNNSYDELYHADGASEGYDGLNRLVEFQRGALSDTNADNVPDTVTTASRTQVWDLDVLGNWDSLGGSDSEDRTHNMQNQITGGVGATPAYDDNGNMITNQNGYTLTYDAWNRLVDVRSNTGVGATISAYAYDGLGRRVTQTPAAGAHQLGDISEPRMNPFDRSTFAKVGDILMFTDSTFRDLYKTDGTVEGTEYVTTVGFGSTIGNITAVGSLLFFTWSSELWVSDGTSGGTQRVKDINTGGNDAVQKLVNVNGTLFFSANDGSNGAELWKSDGTSTGTVMVKDIWSGASGSSPDKLVAVGSTLFFAAREPTNQLELWKSDGTSAGTVLVKDINPGGGAASSSPQNLGDVNGTLFFSATDGTNGQELWKSDGTSGGTVLVKDIRSGSSGSTPRYFRYVNGLALFAADDGSNGVELWKSDGTSGGTSLVLDINGTSGSSIFLQDNWAVVDDTLYFAPNDGTHGYELWKSDGTSGGTEMVLDINSGSGNGINHSSVFWITVSEAEGSMYFRASDGTNGEELWKSDGTSTGTGMFQDIYAGASSSSPYYVTEMDGRLFFSADGGGGRKLWSADLRASDLYYTDQWQVAEEQIDGVTTQQNVFSPVYIDAVVVRDRDLDGDGHVDDERIYVMQDANFNVTGLVDDSGTVLERVIYDPYLKASIRDANWAADGDGMSDVSNVYLGQGLRHDVIVKLYNARNRPYDADLGRPISPDPARYVDGANYYQWVLSNPMGMVDPSGLAAAYLSRRLEFAITDYTKTPEANESIGRLVELVDDIETFQTIVGLVGAAGTLGTDGVYKAVLELVEGQYGPDFAQGAKETAKNAQKIAESIRGDFGGWYLYWRFSYTMICDGKIIEHKPKQWYQWRSGGADGVFATQAEALMEIPKIRWRLGD